MCQSYKDGRRKTLNPFAKQLFERICSFEATDPLLAEDICWLKPCKYSKNTAKILTNDDMFRQVLSLKYNLQSVLYNQ